jgi:cytochrome c oxidase accessory protein FixG
MASEQNTSSQSGQFRDRVTTIDDSGRRTWIYPKKPSGPLHRARLVVGWILLLLFILGPFLQIQGQPLLLLDIIQRKFFIFGVRFWPQDFHLLVLGMMTVIVIILLFTAVYGRLFCGWACPQTIFMELVFRKIEYLIEGDAKQQRRLNQRPWDADKILRKSVKHGIFFGLSFLFGNVFLAYFIGSKAWLEIITDSPIRHLGGLAGMLVFAGAFYFVFAWFREQVCTMVCPYGRLQSVLLDDQSIVVSYDYVRGEPRTKDSKKTVDRKAGDCVDCFQCVKVCPTGIDIRNGTQLECINCTACIDACNHIMIRLERPKGLIRYASHNSILGKTRRIITPRVIGYTVILVGLIGLLSGMVAARGNIEVTILRVPGSLYQVQPDHTISNMYTFKIVNKTSEDYHIEFKTEHPVGKITVVDRDVTLPGGALLDGAFFIELQRDKLKPLKTVVQIGIYSHGRLLDLVRTTFLGPAE